MLATFHGGLQVSLPVPLAKKKVKQSCLLTFPNPCCIWIYIDPWCLHFCLGKHFLHFHLDWREPQTAFVLSHDNYRLLPWQNNNLCNKERLTDELTALMPFYCPLPSISSSPCQSSPPPLLIWLVLITL